MAANSTRHPRALKFGELIDSEPQMNSIANNDKRSFNLLDLPDELRDEVYLQTPFSDLFRLAQTGRAVRQEVNTVFYCQRHYWYLYYPISFGRGLAGVAECDTEEPQVLMTEDLLAARHVRQLKISSAALDLQIASEWAWLSSFTLWDKVLTYFPSLIRVMMSLQAIPDLEAHGHDDIFWKHWDSICARVDIDIWFQVGSSNSQTYFMLDLAQRRFVQGNNRQVSVRKPHLPRSVYVEDFIRLPRISGRVGWFLRYSAFKLGRRPGVYPDGMSKSDMETISMFRRSTGSPLVEGLAEDHFTDAVSTMTLFDPTAGYTIEDRKKARQIYQKKFLEQLLEDPLFKYKQDPTEAPIWRELQQTFRIMFAVDSYDSREKRSQEKRVKFDQRSGGNTMERFITSIKGRRKSKDSIW